MNSKQKADSYVKDWIARQEKEIKQRNAGIEKSKPKINAGPELSEADKMRIDIEVNRRMQGNLRADKRDYMKSEQEIKSEVLELFKQGEL